MAALDSAAGAPQSLVWPVAALVLAASDTLAARFGAVAVRGEISGFTRAASGHLYFSLKDSEGAPAHQVAFGRTDNKAVSSLASRLARLERQCDEAQRDRLLEKGYPAEDHHVAYQVAHEAFLGKTVHAGEDYGPESIFQAIGAVGSTRASS